MNGTSWRLAAAVTALLAGSAGLSAEVHPPGSTAAATPDTVFVAPPTGERTNDRASILAALEHVAPGGTVQFAAGTYLVGEMIRISTPDITVLGHAEGTTLRGCDPEAFADRASSMEACNGLELAGARQTVRGITFEHAFWALHLGCCLDDWPMHRTEGGHLVEGNTFRSARTGVRVNGDWTEPAIIRNNRFLNNWHSVSINGNTVHLLDNDISAPEPEQVPFHGVPWDAVKLGPPLPYHGAEAAQGRGCSNNVIAGNRIDGIVDGIRIEIYEPGTTCRHNVIRDNTIDVGRARPRAADGFIRSDPSDPSFVGVPLALLNYPQAFHGSDVVWTDAGWRRSQESGGRGGDWADSAIEDNVIEGNRISGAEGVGMEILHASRNRIVNNTITGIKVRERFPGNYFGPLPELELRPAWQAANGSGIWLSPGSDENEILGNTFEDVAAGAIVLEGGRNRVEHRDASDAVRDLGSGNRVSVNAHESRFVDARGIRLHYLDFGGSGLPLLFVHDWYEDAHTWTAMAPAYAGAHRVLAMTRRGYGESDDVGWGYDVGTQAEDILGFMDALGIERAVIVGRHPTTQDMTWIAEHHPERAAGLVYLYHAMYPSPGDARWLRDRAFAEMFMRYGGCWMGEEAYARGAPRLLYRPHYADEERRRIEVPAISFTHPQDGAAGEGELDLLDLTLALATSADPGGGVCDAASIAAPVDWLTALANDPERLDAVRALVPTGAERRRYAEAFERAFGTNLRIVRLEDYPAGGHRGDPEAYHPYIRSFLEDIDARERRRPTSSTPR
jgi:parallel beta-helix repeat protein